MSEADTSVRVDIRHIQLVESAPMGDADDGAVFIALDDPPPVRSIVAVFDAGGDKRALEVTGVVEVPTNGRERGVFGRFIENDALERFAKVGTEHLEDGEPESGDGEEHAANDDDGGSMMAVPAPVVDPDDSEPIDLAEVRQIEEDPESGADRDDEDEDEGMEGEAETGETRRGKRRRGRKRK